MFIHIVMGLLIVFIVYLGLKIGLLVASIIEAKILGKIWRSLQIR
ncbi:hypothetical protein MKX54_20085 [Alkalihalobacillus sp. FSL R5-0424]